MNVLAMLVTFPVPLTMLQVGTIPGGYNLLNATNATQAGYFTASSSPVSIDGLAYTPTASGMALLQSMQFPGANSSTPLVGVNMSTTSGFSPSTPPLTPIGAETKTAPVPTPAFMASNGDVLMCYPNNPFQLADASATWGTVTLPTGQIVYINPVMNQLTVPMFIGGTPPTSSSSNSSSSLPPPPVCASVSLAMFSQPNSTSNATVTYAGQTYTINSGMANINYADGTTGIPLPNNLGIVLLPALTAPLQAQLPTGITVKVCSLTPVTPIAAVPSTTIPASQPVMSAAATSSTAAPQMMTTSPIATMSTSSTTPVAANTTTVPVSSQPTMPFAPMSTTSSSSSSFNTTQALKIGLLFVAIVFVAVLITVALSNKR